MKKKNLFKLLLILVFCLFLSMSKVAAGDLEQIGEEGNNNSNPGRNCNGGCSISVGKSYPFGYRVYIYDENSHTKLASADIIKYPVSNLYWYSSRKTRLEILSGGGDTGSLVAAAGYTNGGSFGLGLNHFYENTPNFDKTFIKFLELTSSGGYSYSMPGDDAAKAQKFSDLFANIGLSYDGSKLIKAVKQDDHTIYLFAEPMLAFYNVSEAKFYIGTATEMTKYLRQYDLPTATRNYSQQAITLIESFYPAATLVNFDGGGYKRIPEGSGWLNSYTKRQHYDENPLFSRVYPGNGSSPVEGMTVIGWRLNDLITECTKCCVPNPFCCEHPDDPICGPPTIDNKCQYSLSASVPYSCNSGSTSGSVKDIASWDCVFKSNSVDNDSSVKNHYVESFSNSYCAVYCKEEVIFDLPKYGSVAKPGRYFTIGSYSGTELIGPIQVVGTKTCRVTSKKADDGKKVAYQNINGILNYTQFAKDLAKKEEDVKDAWDAYQKAIIEKELLDDTSAAKTDTQSCTIEVCPANSCCGDNCSCPDGGAHDSNLGRCNFAIGVTPGAPADKAGCEAKGWHYDHFPDGGEACWYNSGSAASKVNTCAGQTATGTYYDFGTAQYTNWKGTRETIAPTDTSCSCSTTSCTELSCGTKPSDSVESKQTAYNKAVTDRDNVIKAWRQCNNYINNYIDLSPTVTFTYNNKYYNVSNVQLVSNTSAFNTTAYYNSGKSTDELPTSVGIYHSNGVSNTDPYTASDSDNRGYTNKINITNCAAGEAKKACTAAMEITIPVNTWYESKTVRTYDFSLPEGLYQYISRTDGQAYHKSDGLENFEKMPFSILPVHMTEIGDNSYDESIAHGHTYTVNIKLGSSNKFNKYVFTGSSLFNRVNYHGLSNYSCAYKVSRETVLCDLNNNYELCLKYRVISLNDPFPGKAGTGRTPGYNWQDTDYGEKLVEKYITKNRGSTTYDVYKLDPMYEVVLTPTLIAKINKYNSEKNRESVSMLGGSTAFAGYSDFSLVCEYDNPSTRTGSKRRKCTSKIIRDWGVRGCGISKDGTNYTNCGNTVKWSENTPRLGGS